MCRESGPLPPSSAAGHDQGNFGVVPDANWFMLRALYRHNVDTLANKFTLDHLRSASA